MGWGEGRRARTDSAFDARGYNGRNPQAKACGYKGRISQAKACGYEGRNPQAKACGYSGVGIGGRTTSAR